MKYLLFFVQVLVASKLYGQNSLSNSIIDSSRKNCIQIIAGNNQNDTKTGTGFFIKYKKYFYVITCYHVVSSEKTWRKYDFIKGTLYNGENILLYLVSPEYSFIYKDSAKQNDYAILRIDEGNYFLKYHKKLNVNCITIDTTTSIGIGNSICFTGYPFSCPMLTHTGSISGSDSVSIYIQSPINPGNSGGALINDHGNVIGVIDFKITGIPKFFEQYKQDLLGLGNNDASSQVVMDSGQIIYLSGKAMNLQLISVMETTLNSGIGGAINIKYVARYLKYL